MEDNRRTTFRAALVDAPEATLVCGRTAIDVALQDESSGGLSVVAETAPSLPLDSEAELKTADGRVLRVVVKHYSQQGSQTRIGLQRREVPVLGRTIDPPGPRVGILAYVVVVLIGLMIGLALSAPARQWFQRLGS
jgi:hypothetical protein